jgi:hypothetical protein
VTECDNSEFFSPADSPLLKTFPLCAFSNNEAYLFGFPKLFSDFLSFSSFLPYTLIIFINLLVHMLKLVFNFVY